MATIDATTTLTLAPLCPVPAVGAVRSGAKIVETSVDATSALSLATVDPGAPFFRHDFPPLIHFREYRGERKPTTIRLS
jgi:hypothetical protein